MRLTIFSRLSIGYALIIIFVTAASVHALMELLKFKEVVSIIEIDKRADELQTKLTDAFLSEIRNEMKFIILRDQALYEQSVVSKDDFYRYLAELKQISFSDARFHAGAYRRRADGDKCSAGYLSRNRQHDNGGGRV